MDIFNKKTIDSLQSSLSVQKDELDFMKKSFEDLEKIFEAERLATGYTYDSLTKDFAKVGDPYMNNVYVRKAIDIKSKMISSVPFKILDANDVEVPKNRYPARLFDYINKNDTPTDFVFEICRSLDRFGKAFIVTSEETLNGYPVQMEVMPADRIKPQLDSKGSLLYWEYNKPTNSNRSTTDVLQEDKSGIIRLDPAKVIFIRYKHPTNVYDGLPPGSAAVKEILQDYYAQVYNIKNFQNGAMGKGAWVDPSGTPLTAKQREEAQWAVDNEFNKGVSGAGSSTVLNRKLDWIRTSETNRDLEFITLLDKMRDAILIAYEVPKVIFLSAESTFTNLKEAKKMLYTQTLIPTMGFIEDCINGYFFPNNDYKFKFDISTIPELQDELSSKLQQAAQMQALGISMSAINARLDLGFAEEDLSEPEPATPQLNIEEITQKAVIIAKKQMILDREKSLVDNAELRHEDTKSEFIRLRPNEKQLGTAIHRFYGAKYKEVEGYIKSHPIPSDKSIDSNKAIGDWVKSFQKWLSERDWGADFFGTLKSTIETIFNKGCRRTYTGIGANWELNNRRALAYLTQRGLKLQGSPHDFLSEIMNALEGKDFTVDSLVKTISTKWKDVSVSKAKLISLTETTAAYNGGRMQGMKELGISKKAWSNSHDDIVRPAHEIDGQTVGVDDMFTLADGEEVMYPGDGSAANSCNCRCSIVSVLDDK